MKKKYNIALLNGTVCTKYGRKKASVGIKNKKIIKIGKIDKKECVECYRLQRKTYFTRRNRHTGSF